MVAVAVSGGGDSMALTLLADAWARRHGGRAVALTVDHGLRPESAAEAAVVGAWLAARGIDHHVLAWEGVKPRSAIQEAARTARYELMSAWCRRAGVLHLLLAHQLEDQAETFLMRLERGSGADGLAAMSALAETGGVRLLRPLLGIPRERLRVTLARFGQEWVEDPSNHNQAFGRVRIRRRLAAFAEGGCTADRLGRIVEDFGRHRRQREAGVVRLLAGVCTLLPAGYAVIDGAALAAAELDIATGALGRVLATVGGGAYRPAPNRVAALLPWFAGKGDAPSVTLARCRCLRRQGRVVICRENRRLPAPMALAAGERIWWDERFSIVAAGAEGADGAAPLEGLTLAPLGREGWAEVVAAAPDLRRTAVPHPVCLGLPAVRDPQGVREVPFVGYRRPLPPAAGPIMAIVQFSPRNSLSGIGFCLARPVSSTI